MTDVAISIVNTSQRELTLDCLRTLHDDPGRRAAVEIVVLDNASTDGSAEAVRERYPDVRVIDQPFRAGFGANHNTVTRATSSRYVFVLNEDTRIAPGTIDALVDYLDANPRVAIAGPKIMGFDGIQQGSAWRLMTIGIQARWALTLGQRGAVVSTGDKAKPVGAVSACAMLVRREPFEEIGLFDEDYFIFSEEADSAQRLGRLGWAIHYVPSIVVEHLGQAATSGVPDRQLNEHWRSFDLYLERWHSPLEARALTFLTGLGYALAWLAAVVAGRLPARLRPAGSDAWSPPLYAAHVRRAWRGTRGEGIREAAEAFNRSAAAAPPTTAAGS